MNRIGVLGALALVTSNLATGCDGDSHAAENERQPTVGAGGNTYGGTNTKVTGGAANASVPSSAVVDPHKVVQLLALGREHACAVIDGGVKCWGANWAGQLGDGI
ncbi:MAG TPA: hypothetical protein VKP30_01370 [Polyangiaceae bacterium]|nr:hypothetical protein [Polyangiaceae bacterium]